METWWDGEADRSRKGTARNLQLKRAGLLWGPGEGGRGVGAAGGGELLAQMGLHPAAQSALLGPALVPRRHVEEEGRGRGEGSALLLLEA